MNGRWWIAGVAVVGLVLAFLLMPRPDTGADIPDADPTNVDPANFKKDTELAPGTVVSPRASSRRRDFDLDGAVTGVKPGTEEFIAKRNRPEIVYSGKIVAPWSAMKYVLLKDGSDEAKALADEIGTSIMAPLRGVRTSADPREAMDAIEPAMASMAVKVEASSWATDDTVAKSLARYHGYIEEYHQALDSAGVPAQGGDAADPAAVPAQEGEPAAPTEEEP